MMDRMMGMMHVWMALGVLALNRDRGCPGRNVGSPRPEPKA